MTPCLAHHLRDETMREALSAALALAKPSVDSLAAAGVPHYRASELCRRLLEAGELGPEGWHDAARESYLTMLAPQDEAPSQARPGRLHNLPADQRPREKARWRGIEALSDSELLAVLLRTGGREGLLELADRLLSEHDGLIGLAEQDVSELTQQQGLGEAKATEIAAAFEIGKRLAIARCRDRPPLRRPEDVADLVRNDLVALDHEQFWCLPLDARSRLLGEPRIVSKGDVDGTDAGARAFFRHALRANAVTAIAVHNHPSGDTTVSKADLAVTRALIAAGRTIGVALVDHIVIGDGGDQASVRRLNPELWGS